MIGAGVTYLFSLEIGSLNPENRQTEKTERAIQKERIEALKKQAEELKKIQAAQEEELRFRKTIKCLNCVEPEYPRKLLLQGIEGSVSVKVFIKKDGTVTDAIIQKSSGYPSLDKAAIDAAKKSTFNPIERDGDLVIAYDMKIKI